ncbi:NAD(P)-dependent oxidoreductase [Streptomyces sp. CB02414]|uniref:NAD(P)-dependent oxidoreductase n=1 Tax=Streptomyces sp. CB02414 TaxID=1703922 RepID=UPI000B169B36|nr:NAD(P)-dependent oxidoreductase [Streptomyces sp. CB02414]
MNAAVPTPPKARIGFVGAGRMGRPMVRRLLAAGHRVSVLERSAEARRVLAADGADVTTEVREAAAAHVVGLCVHTDSQVRDVCLDGGLIDAMPAGSTLVVHTTCSPRTIDLLVQHAGHRRIDVVDAGISGGPQDIATGRLTLFVGGSPEAVERVRPVLAAYGEPILHLGPAGAGQRMKLLNNAVFAANIGILAQAVSVATGFGIREEDLLRGLGHGSGASRALGGIAETGSVRDFAAAVGEFLGKDLAVVREVTADLGVGLGALADAHDTLARLIESVSLSTPSR